ncbi:hypothetical protein [Parvibaculum sp.]|uniref:hypothetical protein n=1 Tax=Parvibaculum sp. TaxID=2024848 RepID=UPI0032113149
MSITKYLIIAALVLFTTSEARANSIESWQDAGWYMGAYTDDKTGQFSHCAMSANYENGVTLLFAVDRQFGWRMGLNSSTWLLNAGAQYDIGYQVDRGPSGTAKAIAINPNQVTIELQPTSALFRQFQSGRLLTLLTSGQTLYFQLKGTRAALAEILQCTQRHVTQASIPAPNTNPFAPAVPDTNAATASSDAYRAEAATLAANVLSQAGVAGFQLVSETNVPPELKGVDAVWVAPGLLGTIKVYSDPKFSVQDLQASILASDARSCQGKFASGVTPSDNSKGTAIQLFTVCNAGGTPTPINYTVMRRPSGGAYVFAVAGISKDANSDQPDNSAREVNDGIRNASHEILGN